MNHMCYVLGLVFLVPLPIENRKILQTHLNEVCHILIKKQLLQKKIIWIEK